MKSFTKTRTIQSLLNDINNKKIILDTSIQRKADQWDKKKKSLLILSTIEGVIIPAIFIKEIASKSKKTVWEVLDGKQRLTTLLSFFNDEFKLDKSYSTEYANKKFSELEEEIQNNIKNAEIVVNVYQELSEKQTEDIFCRLNNGQVLSSDNILRAHMGAELRSFVDEAINKPFITEKSNFSKGQLRKSEDQGVVLQALYLVMGAPTDLSKKSMVNFVDEIKNASSKEERDEVLESLDFLDKIITEKNKNLKKISLPFIIYAGAFALSQNKEQIFSKNLIEFLDDYKNRQDYLQFCQTSTSNNINVTGRKEYFMKMLEENQ